MYRIVATLSNEHPHRLLALEEGQSPEDHLVRVIDVPGKIAYPATNCARFLARSPGWVLLAGFDEPTDLQEFLDAHPDIQDIDTEERFKQWQRTNPQSQEPAVDPNNTVGAYLRKMEVMGLHTLEQRRAYNDQVRAKRREEMARRKVEE